MNKERSNRKIIYIVVLAIITVVVFVMAVSGAASSVALMLAKGGTVADGVLESVEEHITDVPDGEVRYLINKSVVFENRFSCGDVMLENPESCQYDLKFLFYAPDGKLIYTSPVIAPGQCLAKDKLSAVVKPGEYKCSYSAQAYDGDIFKGEVTGILTIRVG